MKELSIEQKARRYDEAIERANNLHKDAVEMENNMTTKTCEIIFPELKESEDERIRQKLIDYCDCSHVTDTFNGIPWENVRAWLEKQSTDSDNKFIRMRETKPKDISEFLDRLTTVEQEFLWEHIAKIRELDKEEQKLAVIIPKFRIGDYVKNVNDKREPIYEIVYMDKECYVCEYRGKENMGDKAVMHFAFDNPYLRLVEQKPADNIEKPWSEEDERCLTNAIHACKQLSDEDYDYSQGYIDSINWLKSLKPQNTWKPSKKQLEALEHSLGDYNIKVFEDRYEILKSLYKNLKKLREGKL